MVVPWASNTLDSQKFVQLWFLAKSIRKALVCMLIHFDIWFITPHFDLVEMLMSNCFQKFPFSRTSRHSICFLIVFFLLTECSR